MKKYFARNLLIARVVRVDGLKSAEKSPQNIWKFRFFAVTLHPVSRKNVSKSCKKGSKKDF